METIDRTYQRLTSAVVEVSELLPRLQAMLAEPDHVGPKTGTIGRKPDGSEPWNGPAAVVYFDIWHGVGDIVHSMRWDIGLKGATSPRCGDDGLSAILDYAPAASEQTLALAARRLERWADRARQLPTIDESEPWVPVPSVGATPPACPFCHTFGLRMKRRRAEVRCFFPGCVDSAGEVTRARMEPGRMTGEARLVFGDDTTMHWAGDGNGV